MADVRVIHKVSGEIVEMSEYSFQLNRDEYSLIGAEAKVNQRPVIEEKVEQKETLGSENIPSVLTEPKAKPVKKTKK